MISQVRYVGLILGIALVLAGCEALPPTTRGTDEIPISPQESVEIFAQGQFESPKWVKLLTDEPRITGYKWYRGKNCPIGNYSTRDDRYILDSKKDISELERQGRDPDEKIIGARGIWNPTGIICIALSEDIHPTNFTALHELTHAIVYLEHGLDGHNDVFDRKLAELALFVDRSSCPVRDPHLSELIALHTPIYIWGPSGNPTRTPQEEKLFDFCYPQPQTPREPERRQPTPILTATPSTPQVTNKIMELIYDASLVINNRQSPADSRNCNGGSKSLTRWSKTVTTRNQSASIQDADGWTAHVVALDFAQIHPGRRYSDHDCPNDEIHAWVTMERDDTSAPNMTGYTAEWRDSNGNLIATDSAHDGIRVKIKLDQKPEGLYTTPATLIIYHQSTVAVQPTPTPQLPTKPAEKQLSLEIDPSDWEVLGRRERIKAMRYWTEVRRQSPSLASGQIAILDVNAAEWTLQTISVVEEHGTTIAGYRPPPMTKYIIDLANVTPAQPDFTGYEVNMTDPDGIHLGTSQWDPTEGLGSLGQTVFTVQIPTEQQGPMVLKIWDTYEPSLQPVR